MMRHNGGFFSGLVAVLVVTLLGATALLAVAAMRERNIVKAESFLRSGSYHEAAALFSKSDRYSLRPDARVIKGLAESSLGMEDYESAISYYEKLVKVEPNNVEARYKLGLLHIRAKDYGSARKQIEALQLIGTENALSGAEALSESLTSGRVKGFFRDFLKKVAPGLPEIPGITEDEPIRPDEPEKDPGTLDEDEPGDKASSDDADVAEEALSDW